MRRQQEENDQRKKKVVASESSLVASLSRTMNIDINVATNGNLYPVSKYGKQAQVPVKEMNVTKKKKLVKFGEEESNVFLYEVVTLQ